MSKNIRKSTKDAAKRIRQAWNADRPLGRHSTPPVTTVFHVGKRKYGCNRSFTHDKLIIFAHGHAYQHEIDGKLPDWIDLEGLQTALDLIEVNKVMES